MNSLEYLISAMEELEKKGREAQKYLTECETKQIIPPHLVKELMEKSYFTGLDRFIAELRKSLP